MRSSPQKHRLLRRIILRRMAPLLALDAVTAMISLYLALLLRFEGEISRRYLEVLPLCLALLVPLRAGFLLLLRLHNVQWRYAGLKDLQRIVFACALGSLIFTALLSFVQFGRYPQVLPRSVLIIDFLICTVLIGAGRLLPRFFAHPPSHFLKRRPALIYGAGAAGEQLVRDMIRHPEYPFFPAGFIDDNPRKWGTTIHGIRVGGDGNQLVEEARRTGVEAAIVAIPSANARQIRRIVEKIRLAEIPETRILPGLHRIVGGDVTVQMVREVNLEDLMGRKPVLIDTSAIEGFLKGKRVLITGGAGSIGSELVRAVLGFDAASL